MVKIYTSQTCSQCKVVKRFLDYKNVKYEEIDLTIDYEKAVELQTKSGFIGVPVVEINGSYIKGYNPSQMMAALK